MVQAQAQELILFWFSIVFIIQGKYVITIFLLFAILNIN